MRGATEKTNAERLNLWGPGNDCVTASPQQGQPSPTLMRRGPPLSPGSNLDRTQVQYSVAHCRPWGSSRSLLQQVTKGSTSPSSTVPTSAGIAGPVEKGKTDFGVRQLQILTLNLAAGWLGIWDKPLLLSEPQAPTLHGGGARARLLGWWEESECGVHRSHETREFFPCPHS